MNVLLVTNSYAPNAGGMATSVQGLAAQLQALGLGVLVLTPQFHVADESGPLVQRAPLSVWNEIIDGDFRLERNPRLFRAVQDFAPAVIHVHGPFFLGPIAVRLADAWRLPLIYTYHTRLEEYVHYSPAPDLTPERVIAFHAGFANQCDAVLAPSRALAAEVTRQGVASPVHSAPSGLPAAWLAPPRARDARRPARTIGIVGRMTEEKYARELAAAAMAYMQRDARAWLALIGDGPSADAIRQEARACGMEARVRHTGFMAGPQVRAELDRMDVVINAPEADTQCIVLLEAQARGVPVIASDVPVAREFVCAFEAQGAFFPSGRWDALTDRLARFFAASPAQQALARQAARAFAERFAAPALTQRICELYARTRPKPGLHYDPRAYGWVYRALTAALVPVIQQLRYA